MSISSPKQPTHVVFIVSSEDRQSWADDLKTYLRNHAPRSTTESEAIEFLTEIPNEAPENAIGLYLGSESGRSSSRCCQNIDALTDLGIPVVPIVESGSGFSSQVPDALSRINALIWGPLTGSQMVGQFVLRHLGLVESARRVFISYRRVDSAAIADQLWTGLTKNGFGVFLDLYGVEPGEDFQERLREALDDKAFMILLESPGIRDSHWVEYEIGYSLSREMGVLILTWPEVQANQDLGLPAARDLPRTSLQRTDFTTTNDGLSVLSDETLTAVIGLVEESHAEALGRRRRNLVDAVGHAAEQAGLEVQELGNWRLLIRGTKGKPDLLCRMTPRPPDVAELYALDQDCNERIVGTGVDHPTGLLVHPEAAVPDRISSILGWAVGNRTLQMIDITLIWTHFNTML